MSDSLVRLHLFLARHRWLVLLGVGLFAATALLCSGRLKLNEDFTDMLPMSDPAIAEQVEALRQVRQADRLFVDVQTTELDPDRLLQAADRIYGGLREIPELSDFRYHVEPSEMQEVFEQLQARLPTLLGSNDLHELEARLEPAALEKRLAWMKQSMSQPQGMMLKDVVQADPVGLSDTVSGRLRSLQAGAGDAHLVAGRITNADRHHLLLSAVPGFRSSDLRRSAPLVARALQAAREVEAAFPAGAVHIAVTGAHRVALENSTMIRHDTTFTSVIATVAVAALMFAAFRRRWLALLGLVPTAIGALGSVVVFYLTGDPVSAVALGCGSILIGVTVDYGIYVIYHTDDHPPTTREQLARAVAQLTPALTFGALTTMAAFLVMFVSPVSGHRQLGLFGAVGVALAAGFAIVVLPLFVPVGAAGAAPALPLTAALRQLFAWRDRWARVVLPLLLVCSGLCLLGLLRLRFDGDFSRLNGVTPEARRDEAVVREIWGKALSLTTVVVTGATREEALRQNELVYARLRALQDQREVESFASIAPLFPSDQTRQANLRAWSQFWSAARRQELDRSLAGVSAKLGFRPNTFAPFLGRLATLASPSPPAMGATPALDRLLGEYWTEENGRFSVCTLVKAGDRASFLRLRAAVRQASPGARLLNKAALSDEIVRVSRRALPIFAALVVALNAVLLFLLLGRVELVLITLLPMAAGLFWTLGVLGLLGQPIDMANFIFAIFVIGVGGDYSLFMVMAELEPLRGRPDRTACTGGAVTICAGTALLGIGVLVLAKHPAMFSIGLSAWLGISLTLLATLFLVPPCMARLRRRLARSAAPAGDPGRDDDRARRAEVGRRYRYQGPSVEQYVFWKLRTDRLFRAIDEVAPRQGHLLDIGCGYGLVAHWLALGGPQRTLHGIDHDADKIRVARASAVNSPGLTFEEGDLLAGVWPACDAALLCDVLHYFPRDLKAILLRKIFAALRPGGRLLLRDTMAGATSAHGWVARSEKWAVRLGRHRTRHGLHFETDQAHLELLRAAGFTQVELRGNSGLGSNVLIVAGKAPA